MEENFLETPESLKDVTEDQWKQFAFPIGLVNQIKKKLREMDGDEVQEQEPDQEQNDFKVVAQVL